MAKSVLQELENLRLLLETPAKQPAPLAPVVAPAAPASTKTAETVPAPPAPLQSYSQALDDAEVSIDRLSKAMEVAEDEMEAAFRRTGDLHQSNAAKREMEVQELRRVLTAKEQSIDSLRESLSTTKRTLEARLHQTEAALAARHSEVEQLHAEVMTLHAGRKQLEYQLQQGQEDWAERQQQAEAREAEVAASVEELTVQARHAQAAVRKEREVQAGLKKVVEDLQQQVQSLASQLQQEVQARLDLQRQHEEEMHGSSRAGARKKEAVLKELRSQLKAERVHRRTSEQWLKSELRSREEMEALFVAVRDLVLTKPDSQLQGLQWLVQQQRQQQQQPPDSRPGGKENSGQPQGSVQSRHWQADNADSRGADTLSVLQASSWQPAVTAWGAQQAQQLRGSPEATAHAGCGLGSGPYEECVGPVQHMKAEFEATRQLLEGENQQLQSRVAQAKQLLRSTAGEGAASAAQRHDNLAKAHRLLGEVPVAGIRAGNPLASSAESDVGELKDLMRQVHSTNVELVEGLRSEFGASRSLLEKDNQRLQRELQTLRQSLSQQLAALTSVEPER